MCRFHAQRFYAIDCLATKESNATHIKTDMTLNMMLIVMPVANAAKFYQNLQVRWKEMSLQACSTRLAHVQCTLVCCGVTPAEAALLFILAAIHLHTVKPNPHYITALLLVCVNAMLIAAGIQGAKQAPHPCALPVCIPPLGMLGWNAAHCELKATLYLQLRAVSLQTGWWAGNTILVDFPFAAFPDNMGHWAEVLLPLYSVLVNGDWRQHVQGTSMHIDRVLLTNVRREQLEVRLACLHAVLLLKMIRC